MSTTPERPRLDALVVTVSHNHRRELEQSLGSLFRIPWSVSWAVVVVDNACADGTAAWVEERFPEVHVVRNAAARGFAANVNLAVRSGPDSRYVVLLNPDTECLPGLLDRLVAFMDAHPNVGVGGARLQNQDGTLQPSCRRFSTPWTVALRGLRLDLLWRDLRSMRRYLMDDYDHAVASDVDWVTGALLIARREAIRAVGELDERYELYSEDQDWCCRMWRGGWRVSYIPEAQARHLHAREGVRKPWSRAARLQFTSALRMFRKFGWKLDRGRGPGTAGPHEESNFGRT
jgi:N-acetylglucosaminyl-diphospho-decaprenol L-rhamnosyltransferase